MLSNHGILFQTFNGGWTNVVYDFYKNAVIEDINLRE